MTAAPLPPGDRSESLYAAVTRWADHASNRRLVVLLSGAIGSIALVALTGLERWPLAALAGAVGMIALWGLAHHAARRHRTAPLRLVEAACTGLGIGLAVVAAFGLLFWILGPRWVL